MSLDEPFATDPGPRRRLRTTIARSIALVVVVTLAVTAATLTWLRHRATRTDLEHEARMFATLVAPQVVESAVLFRTTGAHALRRRMDRILDMNPDVVSLEVVDVEGRVVMRADRKRLTTYGEDDDAPEVDAALLESVQGFETVSDVISDPEVGRAMRVVSPVVEEWGRHTYSLVSVFDDRGLAQQLAASLILVGGMLVIGLLLADRVSVVLARSITSGVERLQRGARRIQEGDLEHRVEVRSNDEIQDLAESFNDMADKLRQTIERLRDANRELEKLDQTKADLVANVSHELKTPLTALRGYLELLQQGELGALDEPALKAVEVCQRNVLRLTLRIEELVQLSQLEQREWEELTMETVSLERVLQTAVETLEPRFTERGIGCGLELAPGLPPMWASRDQLERVFLNLLDNASKFTERGGSVHVSAARDDRDGREGVLIRVADTGVGIAVEEQLRIFDRFYQVDPSVRRRYGGMGLGLSLVRAIVEAHHGVVWVDSDVGHGSAFSVWLPVRPYGGSVDEASVRRRSPSARLQNAPDQGGGST